MRRPVRRRFWVQSALASTAFILMIVTLISREWIEIVFGVDPDNGDGSIEWLIVAGLAMAALALSLSARTEWRRTTLAAPNT